jgi:hypothetical protein
MDEEMTIGKGNDPDSVGTCRSANGQCAEPGTLHESQVGLPGASHPADPCPVFRERGAPQSDHPFSGFAAFMD